MNLPERTRLGVPERTRLGVFAKYWKPGRVKTRLAASIGDTLAAQVHRESVVTLLRRFANAADSCQLAASPEGALPRFQPYVPGEWQVTNQSDGDLGQRMTHFFNQAFADGYTRVVVIGSDSPTMPTDAIPSAFESLSHYPVVLGPCEDGGYYLVGARRTTPPIFDEIDWSTPVVLQQTEQRLKHHSIDYHLLQEWYDVDSISELRRLHGELQDLDAATYAGLRATVEECRIGA